MRLYQETHKLRKELLLPSNTTRQDQQSLFLQEIQLLICNRYKMQKIRGHLQTRVKLGQKDP